nr:hypothetical protein [Tanacetum cinerariifolium]
MHDTTLADFALLQKLDQVGKSLKREELSQEPSVSELFLRTHQNKKNKVFVYATAKATCLNAQEAQLEKLDLVVKAQSSSKKRLRKYVAQEVRKVVANEVGKADVEEVGKATQQILEAIRI